MPSIPSAPLLVSNKNLITQLRLPSALFHPLSSLLPQVVANLPYNITKDCLLRMLPLGGALSHLYFMLQVGWWVGGLNAETPLLGLALCLCSPWLVFVLVQPHC